MGRILGIDILGVLDEAIVSLHTIIQHFLRSRISVM